jgi:ATP-dependent Clp protease ATP-binding subunit ClpC
MDATFSDNARRVLDRAEAEARILRRDFVGTEHLLLALVAEDRSILAAISVDDLRSTVMRLRGHGEGSIADLFITPRLKQVLRFAAQAAGAEGHHAASVRHLWIGLFREGEGVAMAVLSMLGVDTEELVASVAHPRSNE